LLLVLTAPATPEFYTLSLHDALPIFSGEAFLPPQREALRSRGIAGFQVYATGDLGTVAYESEAHEGLIVDEGVLLEIVRPGTNRSEEHTSELQSRGHLVCRLLLEKKT